MKNNTSKLFFLLCLSLCLIVPTTCKKLEHSMLVSTGEVSSILTNSADVSGMIIDLGAGATGHGHCYATTPNVTISDSKTELGRPPAGGFTSQLTDLVAGTKYYVKAYITDGTETVYGKEISFTTVAASLPTITTTAITSITTTTAISGGNITDDGGATVTARGVCWNTATGPSISNSKTTDGTGTGNFTSNLNGLTPGTTYYVRAYATNSAGTTYGNELSFTTTAVSFPTITTTAITGITENSANGGGNVTNDGGSSVTARGVCWSTTVNPVATGNHTTDGAATGIFTSSITGLTAGTTYYVRAYATNSAGTAYGNEVNFTTSAAAAVVPTLSTTVITAITATTATSGGDITGDGGANVTSKGVCWSTAANPTTGDSKTNDGTATGAFTSSLTGLTASTTYYVRAYATNSVGTAYGNEVTFTTSDVTPVVPTLTTTAASSITQTTATSGGNITSDGGATVTASGVCWSTSVNPIATGSHTTDGTATGAFTSSITGLTANTTYYVRAYATNSIGTAYGDELTFTTNDVISTVPGAPTIGTATAGNAQATVAFTAPASDGGSAITGYTVTSSPGGFTGTGTGSPITVTGLTNGTAYTFTVTATNANGTGSASSASNSVTPSTVPGAPTIGTATAGDAQATVTFTAPSSDGGSAITGYTVTSSPGGLTGTGTASPITVTGLTNGTAYNFTVTATNAIGTSTASSASNSVTPSTIPNSPAIGSATAGNAQATVTFTAPYDGGSVITGYTVTSSPGGLTGTGTASPITVTGLSNTAYIFTVTATNINGTSSASASSNSVTVTTVPDAPTIGTASAENTKATVTFTAPVSDGGSAITGYTVISSPGGNPGTGSASPITVIGLTNGTAYTFTVVATNANGPSTESAASNSVIPLPPGTVFSPATGRIWMDKNLGASQVAASSTDAASYGDLYQWGRAADGHQIRTSGTTSTLSGTDTPGHANFILAPSAPYDWRSPQNANLWQVVTGVNNPCPTGFRIPTGTELDAERASWSSNYATGAFTSPLKLPVAGYRSYSNGSLYLVGLYGCYWSSTVNGAGSLGLRFGPISSGAAVDSNNRAEAFSVRCIKD